MSNQTELIEVKCNLQRDHNFTVSGDSHFKKIVNDFSNELLDRTKKVGIACQATNSPLELTHEHVTTATHSIFGSLRAYNTPRWVPFAIVFEYICAGAVGVGGSNLGTQWGILLFGLGLVAGALSIIARWTIGQRRE